MPLKARPKSSMRVLLNGVEKQANQTIFYIDEKLDVECEADGAETRKLIWESTCEENDSGHVVSCSDALDFSLTEVLFLFIFIIFELYKLFNIYY